MARLQVGFEKHTAAAAFILNGHSPFDGLTRSGFCSIGVAALERRLYDYRHLVLRVCETLIERCT